MKKKYGMGILILVMLTSLLAGCKKSGNDEHTASSEEPYLVTMVVMGSQQNDEEKVEAEINALLKEELNTALDLVVLPWGSALQQMQLMLSGDEKIDVFVTGGSTAINQMKSGQIIDLSGLIDAYGHNLKALFGEDVLNTISIDGFTYGVPLQFERGSVPAAYLRKDLVEKYAIDVSQIKEPKDLEKVFEMVKAGEPDMTMLFSSATNDSPIDRLTTADLLGDGNGVLMDPTTSTEVVNYYGTEEYFNKANMLFDWYEKGYINLDAATVNENWRSMIKAGNVFSLFYIYHPATLIEIESSTSYEFEVVKFQDKPTINSGAYQTFVYSIAQNSENPEKAMQTLDYIYQSEEIMNLLNWGIEGEHYVYKDKEKDIIGFPEGVTLEDVGYHMNLGWEFPNQFIAHIWEGSDPEQWKNMEQWNKTDKKSLAVGFTFDHTGLETQIATVKNVIDQYKGAIASGSVNPEEYIPPFIEELEKAGIQDIIEEKQKQLDQWLQSK